MNKGLFFAGVYEENIRMSTGFGWNINFIGVDVANFKDYQLIYQGKNHLAKYRPMR
jgi:hypothetical protein